MKKMLLSLGDALWYAGVRALTFGLCAFTLVAGARLGWRSQTVLPDTITQTEQEVRLLRAKTALIDLATQLEPFHVEE